MRSVLSGFVLMGMILAVSVTPVRGDFCYHCYCANNACNCVEPFVTGWVTCIPLGDRCGVDEQCAVAHGCFLPGTLVETAGGCKAIEDLQVGDRVLGLDRMDQVVLCGVEKTYKAIQFDYYVINGKLRVTGTHSFLVDGAWKMVSQIDVGDRLTGMGADPIEVKTVEAVRKGVRVYNIEVAAPHTYFAEGVLVHNKEPDPSLP